MNHKPAITRANSSTREMTFHNLTDLLQWEDLQIVSCSLEGRRA